MSRRAASDEVAFGSDSFLDVVANMVGILIILIVIAGLKVSKAPVTIDAEGDKRAPILASIPSPRVASAPAVAAEPLVIEPSPELLRMAETTSGELARIETERERLARELREAAQRERELNGRRENLLRHINAESGGREKPSSDLGRLRGTLDQKKAELLALNSAIEQAESEPEPTKEIRHRLNPVSHEVDGKEIHFRLHKNRVAHVPIDELVSRLAPQIEQKKNWLVRNRSHQGQVGPVGGFVMNYLVEAQPLDVVEDLRRGGGMMRIGLSQWQIIPEPDLEAETADEALRVGSAFVRAVRSADPDATLTLWVYPDSFELYRRLTDFARDEGFTVAARPLPHGVPIAGSPSGSKSAGQ